MVGIAGRLDSMKNLTEYGLANMGTKLGHLEKRMNQSEEIYRYIEQNPRTCVGDIIEGTGWNHYLVEMVLNLLQEKGLIKVVGQTNWGNSTYEIS